ncbi:polysaccharide deacetylase family protein [Sphingomonas baiyangensis]|uniref:polysaccharide deacetylase family protein n=1 Tax=Sphingomonas baiyangensis TaxID=2572576 RepID=UPI001BB00F38|nr:polysaccharide deacetylase family protein [Sphingomonas baiyangensis]
MTPRHAYRPPPPGPPVLWPKNFGTRFAIMVDTEEEFDWSAPFSRHARAVTAIDALPEAHRRFADRGVPIVYLVDHPVAATPRSADALARVIEDGRSAIGAHLHPWVTPPDDEEVSVVNSFAGNLPDALEAAKLDALGNAIEAAFGTSPRIFRAGRYGIGPATRRLLAERGYAIDSSVRPGFDYRAQGGPNFRAATNAAYHAADAPIVELPLTTVYLGRLRRGGATLYERLGRLPRGRGVASRLGLHDRVSLTPEGVPLADALRAIDAAVDDGERLLNFSYHSPTLVPGMTPYTRDAGDVAAFHRWWDAVLARLDARGVRPVGADELIAATRRLAQQPAPPLQPHALAGL